MALEYVNNGEYLDVVCNDCGKIVVDRVDPDYPAKNPNASDKWLHQLWLKHVSHDSDCPEYEDAQIEETCPHCGEVVVTYNREYAENNPNACERWVEQELDQHYLNCEKAIDALGLEEKTLETLFEINLKFPNGGEKTYKLELMEFPHAYGNGLGSAVEERGIWGKGGTVFVEPTLIVNEWSAALREAITDIPEDYIDMFIQDALSAIRYEISAKNPNLLYKLSESFGRIKIKLEGQRRRRNRRLLKELQREAKKFLFINKDTSPPHGGRYELVLEKKGYEIIVASSDDVAKIKNLYVKAVKFWLGRDDLSIKIRETEENISIEEEA